MNTTIREIRQKIQDIAPNNGLKTETKRELHILLKQLKSQIDDDDDDDDLEELLFITDRKLINNQVKIDIRDKTPLLLTRLENKSAIIAEDDSAEEVNDNDVNQNIRDIDDALDAEIEQYNKYTKENPMLGVSWDKKNETWGISSKKYCINTKNKILENATTLIKNKIISSEYNAKNIGNISAINYIAYKSTNIIN